MSILISATVATTASSNVILRTAANINAFYEQKFSGDASFELEGSLRPEGDHSYIFEDETGSTLIHRIRTVPPPETCSARLTGTALFKDHEAFAIATAATATGKASFRPPTDLKIRDVESSHLCFTEIRTTGQVIDAYEDDVDARFTLLLLKDGNAYLPVSFAVSRYPDPSIFIGARVEVTGTLLRAIRGTRKFSGPVLTDASVRMLVPPPADPFAAPLLQRSWYTMTPADISALDKHRTLGQVLATWNGDRALVRDSENNLINIILARGGVLPAPNTRVECVGYPQTDLFRITLANARWRPLADNDNRPCADEPSKPLTANTILLDTNGRKCIDGGRYGELIRLVGVVRSLPDAESPDKRLYLDSGRFKVPVDFSSFPHAADDIRIGAEIEVTGRCIIETSDWSPSDIFPQARGFFLVVRSADDFKVIRNPAWWTPARFISALLVLVGFLVAIFIWNLTLQTLVKRRARQIYKADLARTTLELRIEDRTNLAAEIHDALSQNLTGVSMQLEAAMRFGIENPENMTKHLEIADTVLKSCRTELRNSLWDLRNQALEEKDLNTAIRRTLLPNIKDVRLLVRFNVPRSRLTDATTHEILRIIRELAVNGIVHGGANEIRVAGSIDREHLLFSVRDNGVGFDPDLAPGVLQGHFGLKGVKDRLKRLSGTLDLKSTAAHGTVATISIPLPDPNLE